MASLRLRRVSRERPVINRAFGTTRNGSLQWDEVAEQLMGPIGLATSNWGFSRSLGRWLVICILPDWTPAKPHSFHVSACKPYDDPVTAI